MKIREKFAVLRRALRGEEHDYTEGNLSEAVILLSIPMILELGLESVFAVVDMFFVSRLGQNAIVTVGLTESVVTIIYSLGIGISTGATAIVARRIGEKNPEAAAHAGAQSLVLAGIASIVLSIVGVIFAGDILRLMGASADVVSEGTKFAQIMIGGNLVILLLFLINGIFRGAGDAAIAMKSLWLASIANIIFCPIFIHFFGLTGAAIATVLGRATGVAYQCRHLFKGNGVLKFRASHFALDLPVIKTVAQIAWPASFQFLIGSGSWIFITKLVAESGGTAASAGYQIAFRNFVFFILPAWGLSNAAATLVGQNLGAKKFDRAEEAVYITAKYSAILMAIVTVFFFLFSAPIVRIFTQDPEVIAHGVRALQIIASGYVFYGLAMVMTQALNGAGDTKTPTWINFVCFWILQMPLAYALVKGFDASAIIAVPVSEAILALMAFYFFRRGGWKKVQV